ncbi:MAG: hypothetical protein ROO73_04435 [Roseivirga sp.]
MTREALEESLRKASYSLTSFLPNVSKSTMKDTDQSPKLEDNAIPHEGKEAMQAPEAIYFHTSLLGFVFFTALSYGFYPSYWAYKNWIIIKKAEKTNIRPFWRGLFLTIFYYGLVKRIYRSAKTYGYQSVFSPEWIAACYIIPLVLNTLVILLDAVLDDNVQAALNFGIGLGILIVLCVGVVMTYFSIYQVLYAIKFHNIHAAGESYVKRKFTRFEKGLLIFWGILLGIILLLLLSKALKQS